MNVRQMPLEELELLSYTDIAYELLKLDKKPKTTHALFKEVCDLLQISEDNNQNSEILNQEIEELKESKLSLENILSIYQKFDPSVTDDILEKVKMYFKEVNGHED